MSVLRDTGTMRRVVMTIGLTTLLAAAGSDVYAQSVADPTDAARTVELQQWIDDFTDWQQWWAQWANRPEPGVWASSRKRRAKPAPPEWLAARCAEVFDPEPSLAGACDLLDQWRDDNVTAKLRGAQGAVVQKQEREPKTIWWEHLHVDLLWPATELRTSVFGVVGMHTAMTIKGRVQVFLAPGVMLLNVPALDGSRVWKVAANYGVGYRLFDFTFPGDRRASLHVNIAKSWLVSEPRDLLVARSVDFAGLSVTFKRR